MGMSRAEAQAARLLKKAGITQAPVPVERLARGCGAQVRQVPFEGEMSGLLYREGQGAIIGVNSLHAPTRRRFTMAHELGHLILDHTMTQEPVTEGQEASSGALHVDRKFLLRDARSSQAVDPQEIEANAFAAALLMPREMLRRDFAALREEMGDFDLEDDMVVRVLAERYKVSLQAMLIRLNWLNLIRDADEAS